MSTYDAKQLTLEVGGALITGFADGDFITVVYNSDLWTTRVGADGEGVQSKSNDLSAQITINTLATSKANKLLWALVGDDILLPGFPVGIIDPSTSSSHVTEKARIKKMPDKTYGQEAGNVSWVLETIRLKSIIGGSLEDV